MRKHGIAASSGILFAITFAGLAQAQVIDTFDAGGGTYAGCGLPTYHYFAGAGPIGDRREVYARDGHSNCSADITINAGAGTVEFWSNVTGAEQHLLYGTFIGTLYPGFGTASTNSGLPLNISLTTGDAIEVDVDNMPVGPGLGITLKTGLGDFAWNGSPTVGTNRILLSEFAGLTDAAAADIDGIHVSSGVNGAQGTGIILSEIRFVTIPHAGLVRQTSLLAGDANCSAGGVQIDTGLDNGQGDGTADDNVLDDDEVDSTSYVCNGAAGEDGQNGADGEDGENGANGADGEDGADGVNGADGLTALLRQTTEVPGLNCAAGGIRVDTGLDDGAGLGTANDEVLDDDEVDSTLYVCNGAAGEDGQNGADGENGANGADGEDGQNGQNGANGVDGQDGSDGFSSLITTTVLNAGDPGCDEGGIRIDVGLDNGDNAGTASDSILQSGEIDQTSYVCNGAQGDAGVNGTNGEDGLDGKNGEAGIDGENGTDGKDGKDGAKGKDGAPGSAVARFTRIEEGLECEAGGIFIEAGPDSNANGQLDDAEVQAESKLCTLHSTGGSGCTVSEGQAPTSRNWAGALTLLMAALVFRRRIRAELRRQ